MTISRVKWPQTKGERGHFEWSGLWFFDVFGGISDSKLPLYCTRAKHWQKLYKSVAQNEAPPAKRNHKKTVRALLQTKQNLAENRQPLSFEGCCDAHFQRFKWGAHFSATWRNSEDFTEDFRSLHPTILGFHQLKHFYENRRWNFAKCRFYVKFRGLQIVANFHQFPSFCWLPRLEKEKSFGSPKSESWHALTSRLLETSPNHTWIPQHGFVTWENPIPSTVWSNQFPMTIK